MHDCTVQCFLQLQQHHQLRCEKCNTCEAFSVCLFVCLLVCGLTFGANVTIDDSKDKSVAQWSTRTRSANMSMMDRSTNNKTVIRLAYIVTKMDRSTNSKTVIRLACKPAVIRLVYIAKIQSQHISLATENVSVFCVINSCHGKPDLQNCVGLRIPLLFGCSLVAQTLELRTLP